MKSASLADPLVTAGNAIVDGLAAAGRLASFLLILGREMPAGILRYRRLFLEQCVQIGIAALPLIALTSLFVGGVAALQSGIQLQGTVPLVYVGTLLTKSVFIELGPVLTALVVGSRTGASIAAELGTMRVTEQIDALETLAIRPIRYLVVPRVLAAIFMLPVVTVIAEGIAILGGMAIAVNRVGISRATFVRGMRMFFEADEVYGGLLKCFFFGAVIALSGCFYGFHAEGGAEGVGRAATKAVVASCVLILILDYFLAEVIFRIIFPPH